MRLRRSEVDTVGSDSGRYVVRTANALVAQLWTRCRPVRMRLTVVAAGLVAATLAVAGLLIIVLFRHVLVDDADSATSARAEQIAAAATDEGIAGIDRSMMTNGDNIAVITVIDSSGRVRLSSNPTLSQAAANPTTRDPSRHDGDVSRVQAHDLRLATTQVATPDGELTIEVGAAEGPIHAAVGAVALICAIVFPLVVIGMALLTHHFVGRALRPVDDIRRRVDAISGGDLARRVPVPGTGDEIATLASTMNAMLDRIETARTQQLRFVNDASHELNSPLTTVVGLLDLCRVTREPIDADTASTVLFPEAQRLQHMVADLLLLARSDERGLQLRVSSVDLDDLLSEEVARLEAISALDIEAAVVPVQLNADSEKVRRALRNIIDNGARHARSRLVVEMTTESPTDTVRILVSDDGPGIADADKSRVIDRFVRLDPARSRTAGQAGLGLAITAEIIHAHGGDVIIDDSAMGGASVGFTLPLRCIVPVSQH